MPPKARSTGRTFTIFSNRRGDVTPNDKQWASFPSTTDTVTADGGRERAAGSGPNHLWAVMVYSVWGAGVVTERQAQLSGPAVILIACPGDGSARFRRDPARLERENNAGDH